MTQSFPFSSKKLPQTIAPYTGSPTRRVAVDANDEMDLEKEEEDDKGGGVEVNAGDEVENGANDGVKEEGRGVVEVKEEGKGGGARRQRRRQRQ